MISTDDLVRILIEVAAGREPPESEPADHREIRARLAAEVEQIRDRGGTIEIPPEVP